MDLPENLPTNLPITLPDNLSGKIKKIFMVIVIILVIIGAISISVYFWWQKNELSRYGLQKVIDTGGDKDKLAQNLITESHAWRESKLMSYPINGTAGVESGRVFVILGKLLAKEQYEYRILPQGGENLVIKLTDKTKFFKRVPTLNNDQFGYGEKSEPANAEIFKIGDIVMVEWIYGGLPKKESDITTADGLIKKEFWTIPALAISKRQ
jgi:hypothetical protein